MVKKTESSPANPDPNPNPTDLKFKGVRKRKWGKWVSEIRLPHSRERIWLGSYDCPIKAARAFDAAQICLRGPSLANLNFPNNPPKLDGPTNGLSPAQIQLASATYANSEVSDSGNVDSTQYSDMSSTVTVEKEAVLDGGVWCESGYNESEVGPGPVLGYCDYETLEILGSNSYPNIEWSQYSDMSSTGGVRCESEYSESESGPGPVLDYCDYYETIKILGSGNFDESFGFGDFCGTQFSDGCEYDSLNGSGFEDLSLWNY